MMSRTYSGKNLSLRKTYMVHTWKSNSVVNIYQISRINGFQSVSIDINII